MELLRNDFLTDSQQSGEQLESVQVHEFNGEITDIQFAPDRTYFITSSKDKSAKV